MLSTWEQPLVNECHPLQTYFLFTCATLTDFYETHNKHKLFTSRHVTGVFPYFFFLNKAVS